MKRGTEECQGGDICIIGLKWQSFNSWCCNEGINKKKVCPNQLPMAVQRGDSLHRHLSCLLKSALT